MISSNNDELYRAIDIVIKQQKVSTSYVQQIFKLVTIERRIIEKMEEDGIYEANNAGKRYVLKKNKYLNYLCVVIFLNFSTM